MNDTAKKESLDYISQQEDDMHTIAFVWNTILFPPIQLDNILAAHTIEPFG